MKMGPAAPPVHVISEVNEMGSCSSSGRCHGRCVGPCFNVLRPTANEMGACSSSSQIFGCRALLLQHLSDPRRQKNGASANFKTPTHARRVDFRDGKLRIEGGRPQRPPGIKGWRPPTHAGWCCKRPPGIYPKRARDQRRNPNPDRPGSAQRLPRWVWDGGETAPAPGSPGIESGDHWHRHPSCFCPKRLLPNAPARPWE
mmetsp:Transcript_55512/g.134358  ORF Transcript_55512/g.134358 Transcript_55512/m.134358 type:complete len:200 (-) Transcript_55512:347-946(-)